MPEVGGPVAPRQLLACQVDVAGRLFVQADQRLAERRLSRSALTDEADDLLRGYRQRDIVHCVHGLPAPEREVLRDAFRLDQRAHADPPR